MIKKTVLSICAASLLCTSIISTSPRQAYAGATQAYIAHTSINMGLMGVGIVALLLRLKLLVVPALENASTFWAVVDLAGLLAPFAQAAITQWMDESAKILAKFIGDKGHVTDKWVGPPEINKTIEVMEAFAAELAQFDLSNVPVVHDAYVDADMDLKTASAKDLSEALTAWQTAKDQSNDAIQEYQVKMLYTAQQQAILAMVEALYMKKTFAILASVHRDTEKAIQNQYENTKSTLATLAARRALFNALLIVKYQIARARTRIRAEAFKRYTDPLAVAPEIGAPEVTSGEAVGN